MSDATMMQGTTAVQRSFGERLGRELREAMAEIARLPARLAAARETWRTERDFDRIHDALNKLNKRQLAMLGLKRDEIYSFTELCVFQPERRPELRLEAPGPVLAIAAPEAPVAQVTEADLGAEHANETASASGSTGEPTSTERVAA
ncbi:MAG: hypothetical protein AAF844_00090 [Pseudomonadota bacterium]